MTATEAYTQFRAARLEKFTAELDAEVARQVADGFPNSAPTRANAASSPQALPHFMKKPTIETMTKRLKGLNAKCDKLREKRDAAHNPDPFSPSKEWLSLMRELDHTYVRAMKIERQIINALLEELP